ncbi:hypothetical protein C5C56_07660 [Rathayibacter sp. AY1D1]|uniref:baeRF2 domain-containing protein n=1 Tax=Rathayibacter sp. AY1D1 TaxID=2080542 RepID=UPI000CE91F03|nr:Vms1/Ankzf1 family peptidyl-tRNA hydrolase [Rathayibacter sp. AY1D1]PPH99879.1 hypothetical protein C5C56_07660 [Rathayibacter sp. AY1D1]
MVTTTPALPTLAELLRDSRPVSQLYVDLAIDSGDPPDISLERATSLGDELARQGAPQADIRALTALLEGAGRPQGGCCLFAVAVDGRVVLNEVLPGRPVAPEGVSYSPLPDIVPLLQHRPDLRVLVVETSRDGGEIRLHRLGAQRPEAEQAVQGRTDTLHKAQAGGWRHDRFHHHAEEIWRRTQAELAAAVDELVRVHRPCLLVVAGDIHARQLLAQQLSPSSAAILAVEPVNTRAAGSEEGALERFVDEQLDRILLREKEDVLDALRTGEPRRTVEYSLGAIVTALASAQVETLVLDPGRLRERALLALATEPWVASAPEEALGAEVIDSVDAALALARAAVLTDARVLVTDSRTAPEGVDVVTLPHDADAAAILRWRTGPPVPGA